MSCETVRRDLSLFLYGELSLEEEQALQEHLEACPECAQARGAEEALHAALDRRGLEPSPELLAGCRRELGLLLKLASARERGWLARLREAFSGPVVAVWRRPAAAVALVALGFFVARWTSPARPGDTPAEGQIDRIRFVEPDASGGVRIAVEETRERIFTGRPDEDRIQRLLLAAARESEDPGLRAESVGILNARPELGGVRRALLEAVQHDSDSGVRLKALEGLKRFAAEPEVRDTLARVLLSDQNPGVRIQAIDLLTRQKRQEAIIGVLQALLNKEDNNYVRLRTERALQELNASIGTF
ncbi:MAG: HEAT repeat domain-containing protein [Acidobacteriota bacterium]